MLRKTNMIIVCMAMVVGLCTVADAQMGRGRRGAAGDGGGAGLFPGCPMSIDLTTEQSTKIQELRNLFYKDTAALRAEIFKKEQELDILLLEPAIDIEKAKAVQDEISGLYGQAAQKKLLYQIDVRKILTPDQLRQLPPGCDMGIGMCGRGCGMGMGGGMGRGRGPKWQEDNW